MKVMYGDDGYFRKHDAVEAEQEFGAIYRSIFLDNDHPEHAGYDRGNKLFRNPSWRTIGFDMSVWSEWQAEMDREPPHGVVQLEKWSGRWSPTRPLKVALVERCTDEVISASPFVGPEAASIFQHGVTACPPHSHLSAIVYPSVGPVHIDLVGVMFSREGDWGVFSDDDTCCVLGGEPAFVERVLELGGGEAFLTRLFDQSMERRLPPGHEPERRQFARRCYGLLGREVPAFLIDN
jgi:hypothetical protein